MIFCDVYSIIFGWLMFSENMNERENGNDSVFKSFLWVRGTGFNDKNIFPFFVHRSVTSHCWYFARFWRQRGQFFPPLVPASYCWSTLTCWTLICITIVIYTVKITTDLMSVLSRRDTIIIFICIYTLYILHWLQNILSLESVFCSVADVKFKIEY